MLATVPSTASADSVQRGIADEAECHICCYVRVPIFQCPNGHHYCGDCHAKPGFNLAECSECRVEIKRGGWGRNLLAEKLVTKFNLVTGGGDAA